MLPDINELRPLLELVSGVVLIGADDYPAEWYGKTAVPTDQPLTPERAAFDRAFIRLLIDETDLPVLGVCGGMQLMAIHAGGALIQDLPVQTIDHRQPPEGVRYHDIEIEPDSRFAEIFGATRVSVNTMHHQAVERTGKGQRISATAPDGVIEAMEDADHPFRLGVQWHPERMPDDPRQQALFRALVCAAT
jgi:putative glutamine amidotransferase